jgi:hypothetical protein
MITSGLVGPVGDDGTVLSQRVPSGQVDLSRLSERWQLLEALYGAASAAIDNRPPDALCARMIDERQVAGHRVYMTAERYLGVAWDNHSALVALIQSPHGLSYSAPWNLLRPTFEAAFHAAWILDPEESLERRRRALRVEWLDELDHRHYYDEVMRMGSAVGDADWQEASRHLARSKDANEASYRSDAEALDLPWPPARVNIRDELGRLSHSTGLPDSDVLLRSVWRALSGHQHGRGSAMLRGSDKSDQHRVPGGIYAVLSINDDAFLAAADVTVNMHMEAVTLLLKRSQTRV